jgi:hypothetical protein
MKAIRGLGLAAIGIVLLSLGGCIVIASSAISEKSGSGTAVSADADDMGVLRLIIPENLTQKANTALAAKCQGKLTDVQTELTMRDFLIVQLYEVSVAGVCQP